MGGCEALEAIRLRVPDARAIVSSGYSSDDVMANYRTYGFRGMVPKPYSLEDFTRVLREVLDPDSVRDPTPAALQTATDHGRE
jgi:DNA-binding NarL/FixJ family response regulator